MTSRYDLPINDILEALGQLTYQNLADEYGVSRGMIAGIARDYKRGKLPGYVYGKEAPDGSMPRFIGELYLEGDYLILNDVHVPYQDQALLERAKKSGMKRVILAGDVVDFASISRFEHRVKPPSVSEELTALRVFFEWLLTWADEVVYLPGNHEERLLKHLSLDFADFVRMVTSDERVIPTPYDRVFLMSGSERWLICHQINISRNKLKVADDLSHKYLRHVLVTHQHKNALARDVYGNFIVCSVGGCHDPKKAAYVQLKTTTSAVQEQGFATIINGRVALYDPQGTFA